MAKKTESKTTKKPQKEISQKKPRKIKTIIEKAEKENITEAENKTEIKKEEETKKEIKSKKETKKSPSDKPRKLTIKEKAFIREYIKTGNGQKSATKAGYAEHTAHVTANKLLNKSYIKDEITKMLEKRDKSTIMSAQEVLEHFTAIARGEEKDQFGLDISASDRLKALAELAKRTIDIENRVKGTPDNVVNIKVDWRKS